MLVLPLSSQANPVSFAAGVRMASDRSAGAEGGAFTSVFDSLKTRFQVTWCLDVGSPLAVLEAARCADVVVALLSAAGGVDEAVSEEGLKAVGLLRGNGMPAVVGAVQHLEALPPKNRADFKRRCAKFMADEFGELTRS